ncbi:Rid family hydrolase [Novosphingobium sp. FKTRR1]|uniref:Rid family hydrolase n=1 Tax=Novosphingobium sp. FKTRR1 TaxID=2879118 RepID=UPI001CEFDB6F|nr:Rid family hydrolase [Novosphingobium sp. FKTRR1]
MSAFMSAHRFVLAAALATAAIAPVTAAQAQVTRVQNDTKSLILDGADVKAGTDLFFLSGKLASPVDPTKTFADVKSIDDLGDTKTQTISALNNIKETLASRGYAISDLIKLTLFVAADPKLGKMDFAGANEGFKQFFKTAENPNTVARSTFQVAALAGPYFLIEIEGIAAKKPAPKKK